MGYYAKIIGGIVLIILGIIAAIVSNIFYTHSQNRVIECRSFGGVGQYLSPEQCDAAFNIFSFSMVGILIGIILIIIGLILLIVGIVKGKKSKVIEEKQISNNAATKSSKLDNDNESNKEKIFCRYCGKSRSVEGEYCSRCGKSSISKSDAVKKCDNCKSTMSEDSLYCSNCGKEFTNEKEEPTTEKEKSDRE
ncbi:MAG: hypothetical protein ACPKPY_06035 [Nitrososphaeraceae archaeon]